MRKHIHIDPNLSRCYYPIIMENSLKIENGLVHVYTGTGKGKTTVSLGLALRAMGWGLRVCMVQFIKGYADIGEAKFADMSQGQFTIRQFAIDLSMGIGAHKVLQRKKQAAQALEYASDVIYSGEYDLVIMDEINNAMHFGLIDPEDVITLMRNKPKHVELVLTGRDAPESIIESADYVTDLQMIKHPYEKGIKARAGVDY